MAKGPGLQLLLALKGDAQGHTYGALVLWKHAELGASNRHTAAARGGSSAISAAAAVVHVGIPSPHAAPPPARRADGHGAQPTPPGKTHAEARATAVHVFGFSAGPTAFLAPYRDSGVVFCCSCTPPIHVILAWIRRPVQKVRGL